MLPSGPREENFLPVRMRIASLVVLLAVLATAAITFLGGGGVSVPFVPGASDIIDPVVRTPIPIPSDWYVQPTIPPPSFTPVPTPRPGSGGRPSASPIAAVRLPDTLGVTATDGSRYGDTWSFEPVFPGGYNLDTSVICHWTMVLADGRSVSTAGLATSGFCGAWRVTVPFVPTPSGPSDYPAVVRLEMSGPNDVGTESSVLSSPYKALPLDGTVSTAFTGSNLPLLWLDGSAAFSGGVAQVRLHWLEANTSIDSISTAPASLAIAQITSQAYEISDNGASAVDVVVTTTAHDPSRPNSALEATFTIHQPGT